jgi:hypothetical protein
MCHLTASSEYPPPARSPDNDNIKEGALIRLPRLIFCHVGHYITARYKSELISVYDRWPATKFGAPSWRDASLLHRACLRAALDK